MDLFDANNIDDEMRIMSENARQEKSDLTESIILDNALSSFELAKPNLVDLGTPLIKVIELFQNKSIGAIIVVKEGKIRGIITERDVLLKITGKGLDLEKEIVDDYLTPDPETLRLSDTVAAAINKMYVGGFRNVPITDKDQRPIGVITARDILAQIANHFPEEIINIPIHPQRLAPSRTEGG
ncbi:MAG: CBS domain-containing protein [Candidatus Neomarinimicrobiota bacterium]